MKRTVLATIAALAFIAGVTSVQAGENDLGLKASGNAAGPGGDFKGRAETTGSGQSVGTTAEIDSRASANPHSTVEFEAHLTVVKPDDCSFLTLRPWRIDSGRARRPFHAHPP